MTNPLTMTRKWGLMAVAALACALPAAAQGPGMMVPPALRGVLNPVVGSGAVYKITNTNKTETNSDFEITIVGKESVAGKDAYWVEIGMNNANMGQIYMKMLDTVDDKKIATSRMIMQMGSNPPMEMPQQMVNMQAQRAPVDTDIRDRAELVGTEDVTTPAGTFSCQHYRDKDGKGDVWISAKVSPWGLVKTSGANSMELQKVITGATDHITGTPVPFNPLGFAGAAGAGRGR